MRKLGKEYVIPILTIVVGVGWLLNIQRVVPQVDWILIAGLATVGILFLAVGGIDKLTGVVGPFLIVTALCSLLRQLDKLTIERELPILVVTLGALMLLVHMLKLPTPNSLKEDEE